MEKKRPQKYKCPICGEKAIVGQHFCVSSNDFNPEEDERLWESKKQRKRVIVICIAVIVIIAFSWQEIGSFGLLFFLIPGIIIIFDWMKSIKNKGESRIYYELLLLVGRDKKIVENMIEREKKNNPLKSRAECLGIAYEKYKYENIR